MMPEDQQLEEQQERERDRRAMLTLFSGLISLLTVVLAIYPELPEQLLYDFRLWLAHRETVNSGQLQWHRQHAQATGQTADRVILAETGDVS